jgi:hypothetical protein
MARKNKRASRPPHRSTTHVRKAPPAPALEDLVIPKGKCFRTRHPKLRFAAGDAERALIQAQQTRARKGQAYHEERVYECKISEGGCGDFHLTSRTEYVERGTA